MLVRLFLLLVLAVTLVTGRVGAADLPVDQQAELVQLDADDATIPEVVVTAAPRWMPALLVHGTEVEHPSPEPARVFRPPRAARS